MTDKTTSNDLPALTREVTDAEVEAADLSTHLLRLMFDEPFFGTVSREVTFTRTEEIPTAGVLAKDGEFRMWWNPRFVAGLTARQVRGLLKHEFFHLIFEHTTTRRMEPHLLHNYATDLAINSMIPEEELPEGGLIPGKAFRALSPEEIAKIGPEAHARYQRISDKIASLPKGLSAEQYFALLQDVAEDIQKSAKGKSLAQAMADGDIRVDENGDLVDSDGNPVAIVPGSMDHHDGWDDLSETDRDLMQGKLKQALEKAIEAADSCNQWGSIGAETRRKLRELLSKEVPWERVLERFCGLTRRSDRSSTIKRLNRKYPGVHPGAKRNYTASVAVYVDQSGSVSDAALELFFGTLMSLARHTEFTLYNFDTEVDEKSERVWARTKNPGLERTRCGGTDFDAPTRHANKNKHRFDGYIIMTDGEAPKPEPTRLPRCWVIAPGCKMNFDPGQEFVVALKHRPTTGA